MEQNINKCFFDEYSEDLLEYIDTKKITTWAKTEKFKKIEDKINSIKSNNANIYNFITGENIESFSLNDLKQLKEYMILQDEISKINEQEIFKLGIREFFAIYN